MELRFKVFLILICLVFDVYVYKKVKSEKLQLKYSFAWYLISLFLILITIFSDLLIPIKDFFGFEKVSNMIFLFGFFFLTAIVFSQSIKLSDQNSKIAKLTQELAIIKKDCNENEKINK